MSGSSEVNIQILIGMCAKARKGVYMETVFENKVAKWIKWGFCVVFTLVFVIVLFVDKRIEASPNSTLHTIAPNLLLILFPVAVVSVLFLLWKKCAFMKKAGNFIDRRFLWLLWILSGLLLGVQWFISYHIYFMAGWDPSIVVGSSYYIATGEKTIGDFWYYSQYTNQIAVTAVLAWIQELPCFLGYNTWAYFVCIMVDCGLVNLAGVFAALSLRRLTGSGRAALLAFALYAVLVGISPWIVVPYTDTYSILFPSLVFYLYLLSGNAKSKKTELLLWFCIGFLGRFGMMIKPNSGMVFLAILVMELVKLVGEKRKGKLSVLQHFGMVAVAFVLLIGVNKAMISYIGCILNEDIRLTYTHYLMMGLNEETAGSYNSNDYGFSSSQPNVKECQRANLEVVRERLADYGVGGYLYFLVRKTLTNYNDGTFSWWMEGGFNLKNSSKYETLLTQRLRRLFYGGTDWNFYFGSFEHALWLGVLGLLLGIYRMKTGKMRSQESVLLLSLLGSFAFVMLFEARGRYLYCMSPVYVMCAIYGLWLLSRGDLSCRVLAFRKRDAE